MSRSINAIILISLAGSAILAGVVISLIYLFFSGLIYSFIEIIAGGIFLAVILLFLIVFIASAFTFFAMIFYMAGKKPTFKTGNYSLKDEKGKKEE